MADRKVGARAVVRLTVTVPLTDRWGGDCAVSQIWDQAAEDARSMVERILGADQRRIEVRVDKVTAILAEEDR